MPLSPDAKQLLKKKSELVKEIIASYNVSTWNNKIEKGWQNFLNSNTEKNDYEIVSFKCESNGELRTKRSDGKFYFDESAQNQIGLTIQEINSINEGKWSKWSIHSVKRVSDGEMFCVGDSTTLGKIVSFEADSSPKELCRNNMMWVHFDKYDTKFNFMHIEKENKTLFTTQDSVAIYEGDRFWFVHHDWSVCDMIASNKHPMPSENTFSTKAAAENYVIYNKPCLSLLEVSQKLGFDVTGEQVMKLIELARNKTSGK